MAEVVVRAPVELDVSTSPRLRDDVAALLVMGAARVAIDLEATTFIDSTGIGALMAVAKRAGELGVDLSVRGARPVVMTTLKVSGVTNVLRVERAPESS